jgi:hypothetical protein
MSAPSCLFLLKVSFGGIKEKGPAVTSVDGAVTIGF